MNKIIKKIRSQFKSELSWRLFVALQAAGIIYIIYMSFVDVNWSIWPYPSSFSSKWYFPIFNSEYWRLPKYTYPTSQNWTATACIFAPYILTKTFDWINDAKNK